MAVLNLTPLLDSLTGTVATTATFKAEARRAGRRATRVTGAEVAFPTELTAEWDGAAWDVPPQLHVLPVDCYWWVRVAAAGSRLELNGILPDGRDTVDFGDLIAVTPETGLVDASTIAQYQATQQYVSNQAARIDGVAASIFGTVATVQAQIDTATRAASAAASAADAAVTAQTELADELSTVTDSAAAAATSATDAAGSASTAAGSAAAAATSAATAAAAAIGTAADRDAIVATIANFSATSIDGNT